MIAAFFPRLLRSGLDRCSRAVRVGVCQEASERLALIERHNHVHPAHAELFPVRFCDVVRRHLGGVPAKHRRHLAVRALSIVSVDRPEQHPSHFAMSRTLGTHFGLTPRHHQSGTPIDFARRISRQGEISVREALCEAAATLLLRVRIWSALGAWPLRTVKRKSVLCAIVAVARNPRSLANWRCSGSTGWSRHGVKELAAVAVRVGAKRRCRPAFGDAGCGTLSPCA